MWPWRRRGELTPTELRQGTGPLDNLLVLVVSLAILFLIGLFLLSLFGFYPGSPSVGRA
jgi:hypothetical protein